MAKISRIASLAAVAVAAATLTACGGSDSSSGGSGGAAGELRVASQIDLSTMDPLRSGVGPEVQKLLAMYDALFSWDTETGEILPGIAETWEQDSKSLTIKLREGVTFHDGTAVDAEAVKFNIERGLSEWSTQAANLSAVKSVEVIDEYNVKINLSKADPSLPAILADRAGMLVSPTAAKANDNDFSQKAVGAGAYELVNWKRGSSIELTQFDGYWDKELVTAPEIEYKVIPDGQTAANALISGQVDLIDDLAVANVSAVTDKSGIEVISESTNYVDAIYLNTSRPGLSDERVRQALNLAVNREQLVKAAYFGLGTPASGYYPPTSPNYPGDEFSYGYDLDKAKALLAEAGFDKGLKVTIAASPNRTRVAEIVKQNWSLIGVEVEIMTRDVVSAGNGFFIDSEGDALVSFWGGRIDAIQSYEQLLSKSAFYNAGKRETPAVEKGLEAAKKAGSAEARQEQILEIGKGAFADSANVPLSFTKVSVAMSDDVEGFDLSLVGANRIVGTTLTK